MSVRSILKAKGERVVTTSPEENVIPTAHLLHANKIGAAVVVGADESVVGVISERDLARGLALHGEGLGALRVCDLMTAVVLTCGPDDGIERLMATMTESRVRHLPVLENGRLCGIISIGDVVKTLLERSKLEVESLRNYVMTSR